MPRTGWLFIMLAVALVAISGCKSEKSRLEELFAKAGSPGVGRGGVANDLRKQWAAGNITIVEAVSMAHLKCDAPEDAASVAFAGAVLDTIAAIQPEIESKTNELFWIQTGTLAGKAAAIAYTSQDFPLARSLVLAGSDRWQNEAYWREHPGHDALAALVLHKSGESKEALERLRSRPDLNEETQRAYDQIEQQWRRSRGG